MSLSGGDPNRRNSEPAAPTVSVCIPSFNAEDSIAQCLKSVLAQDLSSAEIVLVDNCSTDSTVERATELLRDIPNARIVQNDTNIGRVPNWNRCVEVARGEYLKFAFTNDALLPGALTQLVRAIQNDDEIVMVGSKQLAVNSVPDVLPALPESFECNTMTSAETLEFFARSGFAAAGSLNGMIYRRPVILEHNLWFSNETPYFADFMQALEMATFGKTVLLDADSHCFNMGAQNRYHKVGQKHVPQYLAEHRVCTNRHMELLEQQGCDGNLALNYLMGRYYWYLGQGWEISAKDALKTFSGYPGHQLSVAAKTIWFQTRQK